MEPLIEDETERPAVGVIEALMGKCLKVTTKDGRELTGTLNCVDHLGNILLFDTYERHLSRKDAKERSMNVVIVPLKLLQSAKVLVESDDRVLKILLTGDAMESLGLS